MDFRDFPEIDSGYNTPQQAKRKLESDIPEKGTARNLNLMTHPEAGSDLRRWSRHKIDVRLKVTVGGASGNVVFGRGNTLSQGGMGAYIPCSMTVGTEVILQVSFPYSPAEVTLTAVVRNAEGFRYGLEFQDLNDNVRSLIVKSCGSATLLQ